MAKELLMVLPGAQASLLEPTEVSERLAAVVTGHLAFASIQCLRNTTGRLRVPLSLRGIQSALLRLYTEPPATTVRCLAKKGCGVRALEKQWKALHSGSHGEACSHSLKAFAQSVQFFSAFGWKLLYPSLSDQGIAGRLRITPKTLRDLSRRFSHCSLREIPSQDAPVLLKEMLPKVSLPADLLSRLFGSGD